MRAASFTTTEILHDPNLVRPYRVGMSCGFCHVGPSPIDPPQIPKTRFCRPKLDRWRAIHVGRPVVPGSRTMRNFMYRGSDFRPCAMDASLVSTDNINNPRTDDAVYNLGARLGMAKAIGHEVLPAASATTCSSTILSFGP